MPSSKNYKRDYKTERATSLARGENPGNIARKQARRDMEKAGRVSPKDGKDVDHIKPLSKGGAVGTGNLRVKTAADNRSFARTSSGAIKEGK